MLQLTHFMNIMLG